MEKKRLQTWIYWITPSYLIGIIVGSNIQVSILLIITTLSILSIILILYSIYKARFIKYLIALLFIIIGILIVNLTLNRMSKSILLKISEDDKNVNVEGVICSRPHFFKNSVSFFLKVRCLGFDRNKWKVNEITQVTLFYKNYKNSVNTNYKDSIFLGQVINTYGRLKKIEGEITKKFTWEKYLYYKKIQTKLIIDSNKILKVSTPLLPKIRKYIVDKAKIVFKRNMDSKHSTFLIGAILGDRTEILPETIDHFTKSGLLHILAISGSNMVILASSIIFLSQFFRFSLIKRVLITMVMIISYTYLVGYEVSVIRASVTTLLTMIALILGRKKDSVALLLTSGLFITFWDPFSIYDTGFQLSFLSVTGIFLISPIIDDFFSSKNNFLIKTFSITSSVLLAIAPITLYHFKQFSIVSILSNFLALPVSSLILGLGTICNWLSIKFENIIYPFLWILDKAIGYLFFISKTCANIPYGQLYLSKFSLSSVIIYYLFLLFILFFFTKTNVNKKIKKKLILSLSILLIIGLFTYQFLISLPPKNLSLTFFDVGNGDACLVRTPEGYNILIDGGPEGNDVIKKLYSKGVRKLDLIILSHPHSDHINGLIEVLNEIPVNLVLSGDFNIPRDDYSLTNKYNSFLEIINNKNIALYQLKSRNILRLSSKLNLIPIWPDPDNIIYLKSNLNNQSLAFLLNYENKKILFTGDIEIEAQIEILNDLKDLYMNNKINRNLFKNSYIKKSLMMNNNVNNSLIKADILKVPHQGSKDANFYEFFQSVSPEISVISVGLNNKYGHPSKETINSLKKINSNILRTDEFGDIDIIAENENWKILTER